MGRILPFLAALTAAAFFTGANFFFYLLYALFGIYLLGRWWARRSLRAVTIERRHDDRVLLGTRFDVAVHVRNNSWLPVLWMRLTDTVPSDLTSGGPFRRIVSLLPKEDLRLSYTLVGRRRGYYPVGPFVTLGGDLLGTARYEARQGEGGTVIVYPKILPLHELGLPSWMPVGVLPRHERLFEDPSRVQGVRDYQPGDSLRRMDWKTTARVGSLQVRRYEPAIAIETAILLNLAADEYPQPDRYDATELGIIAAASAAAHLVELRQAVGLACNGHDPAAPEGRPPADPNPLGAGRRDPSAGGALPSLPVRKGREHLAHVLDLLARIEVAPEGQALASFRELVNLKSLALPWGSTVLAITSRETEGLLDSLLLLRRRGLAVTLVLTTPDPGFASLAQRAGQIGVQTVRLWREQDMEVWQ
ncbi:MAG TPA: DUF58 domain-containing protein [Anaerolineae bacterium]|nr:DUF58 domain-containing protein [Anaerolineae bacterium]